MKSKHYKNYLLEDFLVDDDFRNWVRGDDERLEYFWQKWMDSHPEKVPTVLTARQMLLSMQFKTVSAYEDEKGETLQNVIQGRRSQYSNTVPGDSLVRFRRDNRSRVWMSIAASIALLLTAIAAFFVIKNSAKELATTQNENIIYKTTIKGQKLTHTLPDGSRVVLNAESEISYSSNFNNSSRSVELNGEAFFDVVEDKSRPFTVISGNTATQVLGTSFNVNAFPESNETKVSLISGKVKVFASNESGSNKEIVLKPGEKVTINHNSGEFIQSRYDFVKEVGWKENILVFDKADHQSVVKELERWFGVNITTVNEPPKRWEIKGYFKGASLEEVLKSLQYTNKIDFKIENKNVELKF